MAKHAFVGVTHWMVALLQTYDRSRLPKPSGRRPDRQNQMTTRAYKEMRPVTACLFVTSAKPEKRQEMISVMQFCSFSQNSLHPTKPKV